MKQAYDFLICLVSLMLGILLEYTHPLGLAINGYISIAACCLTAACFTQVSQKIRVAAGMFLCFIVGSFTFAIHTQQLKQAQISLAGRYQYLVGIVTDVQLLHHPLYQEHLTIALEGGKLAKFFGGQRLNSQVSIYSKAHTTAVIGDKILLKSVSIKPPIKNMTENDLSLAKAGSSATVFLASRYQCKILERGADGIRATLWRLRQTIYNSVIRHLSAQTAAYTGLLFFGNKQHDTTTDLQNIFARWGLSHYLARSGLHIVLLVAMWFALLRFIPINIRFKTLIFSAFVLLYALCSWESTSFLRALFVFLFTQSGLWLGRETKTLHLLTIVCMGMILYNPFLIFYLDFQLTFGLTFGLLTFSKHLMA